MAMATKSGWVVEIPLKATQKEIRGLPKSLQAKFARVKRAIENEGLDDISHKYKEKVREGLWEMRLSGKGVIARSLYLKPMGRRVIIVHVFIKKKPKIDPHHINIALQRAKEIENA